MCRASARNALVTNLPLSFLQNKPPHVARNMPAAWPTPAAMNSRPARQLHWMPAAAASLTRPQPALAMAARRLVAPPTVATTPTTATT